MGTYFIFNPVVIIPFVTVVSIAVVIPIVIVILWPCPHRVGHPFAYISGQIIQTSRGPELPSRGLATQGTRTLPGTAPRGDTPHA
jgi:hypothetical protein